MKIVDLPTIVKHQVKQGHQNDHLQQRIQAFVFFSILTPSGFCPLDNILPLPKNPFLCQIVIGFLNRDDLGSILNLEDVLAIDSCFHIFVLML